MSQVNYKSTRLLIEAVNREMDAVRKAAMGNMVLGSLNELRDLVAQLASRAERTTLEDIREMAPADYVATMKPLVTDYHRKLMAANALASCLCEDLKAAACVLILIGDGVTVVRAAHDQTRPEMALAVETIIASLDSGTKQVVADIPPPPAGEVVELPEPTPLPFTGEVAAEDAELADLKTSEPEMGDEDGWG